ncbi:GATA zinc finger domain-containing protein 4-like [Microplitis demolitor]|uniref:GATA zinc finger domain-containing protein 4-like n=1 Tax=Microplitis demolitor TaxID=69319 RepID=UPI0004CD2CF9|nr:GATA zinc finger domain-containing protein 4-like [Microplitis demolitor]
MSDHEENGENLGPQGNGGLNPPANNNDLDQQVHNITRHANITDLMITSLGESMTLHQALMQVPSFDGKNMPLQAFLLDEENGLTIVPDNLRNTYFNGVKSKLKDTARHAIADKTINTMNALRDALKEYFASKRTYPQYCADIQAIQLEQNKSILSYYTRINKIRSNAITAINESFNNVAEVNAMKKMLDGLALESFKRGLLDDLLCKIALRLEENLKGSSQRNSNYLAYAQSESANHDLPRRIRTVSFQDEERQNTIPFRFTREDNSRPSNSYSRSPLRNTTPPRNKRNYPERGNLSHRSRSRSPGSYYSYYPPPGYFPPIPYMPPMPYQYSPPGAYSPPVPYNPPYYQSYPLQDNNQNSSNNNYSNNNPNNYNNRNNNDNNNQRYGNNGYVTSK